MNTDDQTKCPFHADEAAPEIALQPPGAWPPGPRSMFTGWSHLRHMARDLFGVLGAWKQQYGDVVHLRIWPEHLIVVTQPHLVRELLVSHQDELVRWERGMRVFSQSQGHSVFISEGQAWRAKRHALQPAFTPKAVQAWVGAIAAATRRSLDQWPIRAERWPVEAALTSLTMDVIVRMMFSCELGTDARAAEQAVRTLMTVANEEIYWAASWPDVMPWKRRKREALAFLKGWVDQQLQSRLKTSPAGWPDDLLSRLLRLNAEDAIAWPLQAVKDECMTVFLAGHETVAASLTWWAWCMAAHPQFQTVAREEVERVLQGREPTAEDLMALPWLTQTLQETLRLYPAAPILISRRSRRALRWGGWQLPARTIFMLPVQLMHHDPRWFPDPMAFLPERFATDAAEFPRGAYMPFGTGPRVCLGQHLAMSEMTVIAAMLLQRMSWSPVEAAPLPEPVLQVSLRPKVPLELQLEPIVA